MNIASISSSLDFMQSYWDDFIVATPTAPLTTTTSALPAPTKTTEPICPEPAPTVPTAPGGGEQDLICSDSNLASQVDCLSLPALPAGTNNGIDASNCLPNTSGTNNLGELYCSIAVSPTCSMVMVFRNTAAQTQLQSRDDLVAIVNDSNMFCFRVCDQGPLEGSSVINIAVNVRVCIIATDSAASC